MRPESWTPVERAHATIRLEGFNPSMGPESWTPVEPKHLCPCPADAGPSMGPESWTPVERGDDQDFVHGGQASMGPESWTPVDPCQAAHRRVGCCSFNGAGVLASGGTRSGRGLLAQKVCFNGAGVLDSGGTPSPGKAACLPLLEGDPREPVCSGNNVLHTIIVIGP